MFFESHPCVFFADGIDGIDGKSVYADFTLRLFFRQMIEKINKENEKDVYMGAGHDDG